MAGAAGMRVRLRATAALAAICTALLASLPAVRADCYWTECSVSLSGDRCEEGDTAIGDPTGEECGVLKKRQYCCALSIDVTSPTGAGFYTGDDVTVRWAHEGLESTNVRIDLVEHRFTGVSVSCVTTQVGCRDPRSCPQCFLTVDGGVLAQSVGASAGSHPVYDVPTSYGFGDDYAIKIQSTTYSDVVAYSAPFEIKRSVTLINPPSSVYHGTPLSISWTRRGTTAPMKIEAVKTGLFGSKVTIASAATGSAVVWNVPSSSGIDSDEYFLRITSTRGDEEDDVTDDSSTFTIRSYVNVISPNEDSEYAPGDTLPVTWSMAGIVANVKVELRRRTTMVTSTLVTSRTCTASSYGCSLTVPNDAPLDDYFVEVYDVNDSSVDDKTADFPITASISISSPRTSTLIHYDDTVAVRWSSRGVPGSVKIELLEDNLLFDSVLDVLPSSAANTANDGTFSFVAACCGIPADENLYIRITSRSNGDIVGESERFKVRSEIDVGSFPDTVYPGETNTIRWTENGAGDSVSVEVWSQQIFSDDKELTVAASAPAAAGSIQWTVPFTLERDADLFVRVCGIGVHDETCGDSRDFEVKAYVQLGASTIPAGYTAAPGETIPVAFSSRGVQGMMVVQLVEGLMLGGSTTIATVAGIPVSAGAAQLTVPEHVEPADDFHIRIFSGSDSTIEDTSRDFAIVGVVTISSPTAGQKVGFETDLVIEWQTRGVTGSVSIELFKDRTIAGDQRVMTIAASTPDDGRHTWTVPLSVQASDRYFVRITSLASGNGRIFGDSPKFEVLAEIQVSRPAAGDTLYPVEAQEVRWSSVGVTTDVEIVLMRNTLLFDTTVATITPGTADDGAFAWALPEGTERAGNYFVRVIAHGDSDTQADSGEFSVDATISVTQPGADLDIGFGEDMTIGWASRGIGQMGVDLELWERTLGGLATTQHGVILRAAPAEGTFVYTIPEDLNAADDFFVKVVSRADSDVVGTSPDFHIRSFIRATAPAAGAKFDFGDAMQLSWESQGVLGDVRVELREDSFLGSAARATVVASTANDGAHTWNIPESGLDPSGAYFLRVYDKDDEDVYGDTAEFLIGGSISFVSPTSETSVGFGDTLQIQWTGAGVGAAGVKLELWEEIVLGITETKRLDIASGEEESGSRAWMVPYDTLDSASDFFLRAYSLNNEAVRGDSQLFRIHAVITVQQPSTGAGVYFGEEMTVSWTTKGVASAVVIELREDKFIGTTLALTLATSQPNDDGGSATFTIPYELSIAEDYFVRVIDAADEDVVGESGLFQISGFINVRKPDAATDVGFGDPLPIRWTSAGVGPSGVRIKLMRQLTGGLFSAEVETIKQTTEDDGVFDWLVPLDLDPRDSYFVRVESIDHEEVMGDSAPFTIRAEIRVLAPKTNDGPFFFGDEVEISWLSQGVNDPVHIELREDRLLFDQFHLTVAESTTDDGTHAWRVPFSGVDIAADYYLRVSDAAHPEVYGDSQLIAIRGLITVSAPADGDKIGYGEVLTIEWSSSGVGPSGVDVFLYRRVVGGLIPTFERAIASGLNDDGEHAYTVPLDLANDDDYFVRVQSIDNADLYGDSGDFHIRSRIVVTRPAAGDEFELGATVNVEWASQGVDGGVQIQLRERTLGGLSSELRLQVAQAGTSDSGAFSFALPAELPAAGDYFVRIIGGNAQDPPEGDSGLFGVGGSIVVLAPALNDVVGFGNALAIEWTSSGVGSGGVRIELLEQTVLGLFSPVRKTISYGAPDTGTFTYLVPNDLAMADDYVVRITAVDNDDVRGESGVFALRATITVHAPRSSDSYNFGDEVEVHWSTSGVVGTVKVELWEAALVSTFDSRKMLIAAEATNDGVLSFAVPTEGLEPASDFYVRVVDNSRADVEARSAQFSLGFVLDISAPNAATDLGFGETMDIIWTLAGAGADGVVVELWEKELLGLASFKRDTIVDPTPNDGAHQWPVPATLDAAHDYFVRITSKSNPAVTGDSEPFHIRATIEILAPEEGDKFDFGDSITISWSTQGVLGSVGVELREYTNLGLSNTLRDTIDLQAPNTGSLAYTIPHSLSPAGDYFVRVFDAQNPDVDARSGEILIGGAITVSLGSYDVGYSEDLQIQWVSAGVGASGVDIHLFETVALGLFEQEVSTIAVQQADNDGGQLTWQVPANLDASYKYFVRITSRDNDAVTGDSLTFAIRSEIAVQAPAAGATHYFGDDITIRWTSQGVTHPVELDLYRAGLIPALDALVAPISLATEDDGTGGSFVYTIPYDAGLDMADDYYVKVVDLGDPDTFGKSARFEITGLLSVTHPAEDEYIGFGDALSIRWTSAGVGPSGVRIRLYDTTFLGLVDDHELTIVGATEDDGEYAFGVPENLDASHDYFVRVESLDNPAISADSAYFRIGSHLDLTTPAGGDKFDLGEAMSIAWTARGVSSPVRVELHEAGLVGLFDDKLMDLGTVAMDGSGDAGAFTWQIPADLEARGDYYIKVVDTSNEDVNDASGNLLIGGSIAITQPAAGERVAFGETITVSFVSAGVGPLGVKLELWEDRLLGIGEERIALIADAVLVNEEGAGSVQFTIPMWVVAADDYYIRAVANDNPESVHGESARFEVYSSIDVTAPAAGAAYDFGEAVQIAWTSAGVLSVRIELFERVLLGLAADPVEVVVAQTAASVGVHTYTLPVANLPSASDYFFRVSDASNPNVYGTSPEFAIGGAITVTAPVEDADIGFGDDVVIRWTSTGVGPSGVRILLFEKVLLGLGSDLALTIAQSAPDTGILHWTVPEQGLDAAHDYFIKILAIDNAGAVNGESALFKIRAHITVTAPEEGAEYLYGDQVSLSWSQQGVVNPVRIALMENRFFGDSEALVLETAFDASLGAYSFSLPETGIPMADDWYVRISETGGSDVRGDSAEFKIHGLIVVTAPIATDLFGDGDDVEVTWTTNGVAGQVNVDLMEHVLGLGGLVGSRRVERLEANGDNDGTMTHALGDHDAGSYFIRVTSVANEELFGDSQDFDIGAILEITQPITSPQLRQGDMFMIRWSAIGVRGNVRLALVRDGSEVQVLAPTVPEENERWPWSVDDTLEGEGFAIRITVLNSDGGSTSNFADSPAFSIVSPGSITVLEPGAGTQSLTGGSQAEVQWQSAGLSGEVNVTLWARPENDALAPLSFQKVIANNVPNTPEVTNSRAWQVPQFDICRDCMFTLRVMSVQGDDSGILDLGATGANADDFQWIHAQVYDDSAEFAILLADCVYERNCSPPPSPPPSPLPPPSPPSPPLGSVYNITDEALANMDDDALSNLLDGVDPDEQDELVAYICQQTGVGCPDKDELPVVGIVLGSVFGLLLLILCLLLLLKRSHQEAEDEEFLLAGADLEAAVDVRSAAYSVDNPMFDGSALAKLSEDELADLANEKPGGATNNAPPAGQTSFATMNPLMRMLRGMSVASSGNDQEGLGRAGSMYENAINWRPSSTSRASDALYDNPVALMAAQDAAGGLASGVMLNPDETTAKWDQFVPPEQEMQFKDNPMAGAQATEPDGIPTDDAQIDAEIEGGHAVRTHKPTLYEDNPLGR